MRWGIGIADGERGERGRKVGKGVRNRAESDMLGRERETDGKGEAGRERWCEG